MVQQEQASAGLVFLPAAIKIILKRLRSDLTSDRFVKTLLGARLELGDEVVTHGDEGHVGLSKCDNNYNYANNNNS